MYMRRHADLEAKLVNCSIQAMSVALILIRAFVHSQKSAQSALIDQEASAKSHNLAAEVQATQHRGRIDVLERELQSVSALCDCE